MLKMGNFFAKKSPLTVEYESVKLNQNELSGDNYIIKSDYQNEGNRNRPYLFQLIKDDCGNKLQVCHSSENAGKSVYFRVQSCSDGRGDWIIKAYDTKKLMWVVHQGQLRIQEYPNDNWSNPPQTKFRFQFEPVAPKKSQEIKYRIRNLDPGFKIGHNYLSFDQSSREATFTNFKEDDPCQLWSLHFRLKNL